MAKFDGFREMLNRLDGVRDSMSRAQNTKLMMRWERYGDYRGWPIDGVIDHLYNEWEEFDEALNIGDRRAIRDEVLDIANILDMIWDIMELARA